MLLVHPVSGESFKNLLAVASVQRAKVSITMPYLVASGKEYGASIFELLSYVLEVCKVRFIFCSEDISVVDVVMVCSVELIQSRLFEFVMQCRKEDVIQVIFVSAYSNNVSFKNSDYLVIVNETEYMFAFFKVSHFFVLLHVVFSLCELNITPESCLSRVFPKKQRKKLYGGASLGNRTPI